MTLKVITVVIMIRNREKEQDNYEKEQVRVKNSEYFQSIRHSSF